ncbi:MAG TPA: ATP-binding cassette domain-containing protein, partial [Methylomirabilota bacterium]|nr:ATP-binding cassette domain-containing protein [Methylomirabilota bacterium]
MRVEVQGLTVRFGAVAALYDVSLAVASGERRAVIGPNGAGKTTLFNAVAGDLRPTAGAVVLDGADVTSLSSWRRARLGLARTFQRSALFPELSVAENLALAVRNRAGQPWRFWPGGEGGLRREVRERLAAAGLEAV